MELAQSFCHHTIAQPAPFGPGIQDAAKADQNRGDAEDGGDEPKHPNVWRPSVDRRRRGDGKRDCPHADREQPGYSAPLFCGIGRHVKPAELVSESRMVKHMCYMGKRHSRAIEVTGVHQQVVVETVACG